MPNWGEIASRASDDTYHSLFLSPASYWLVLDVLDGIHDRRGWGKPDDTTWDEIDAAIALAQLEAMRTGMIGQIIWMAVDSVPDNVLVCDGAEYDRVDYPELYAVLSSAFIVDADTFATPDLQDRFVMGDGSGSVNGDTGGEATHTLTEAEMPVHSHSYLPPAFSLDTVDVGLPNPATTIGAPTTTGTAGSGSAHNNLPPYLVLTPCLIAR